MVEGVGWDVPIDMSRQKIVLRIRVMPQRVRPPKGQSFLARYQRVSRQNLPRTVTVRHKNKSDQETEEEAKNKQAEIF